MKENKMILGKDVSYSLDSYETKLNNNVLVVGASGAGKTRSIVTPNLLMATGSYIVSDPKGNLYDKYGKYLESKGYIVKKLDFTEPEDSAHYNFFKYIREPKDIVKVAHMLIYQRKNGRSYDPFWDESAQLLLQSMIAYLKEGAKESECTLHNILTLVSMMNIDENDACSETPLDVMMQHHRTRNEDSYACRYYDMFRAAAGRTLRSIIISTNARLGLYDMPETNEMMAFDDIDITSIGKKKTALFVVVSDTDRSLDGLANIFFTQAMNELCRVADKECIDNRLPIPVRFIMDDFATNCRIDEFPRMIASIRSRGISTMLMIQSEAQLKEGYGEDDKTIIANCDTYVYLGGNDLETAKTVAERCDIPEKKILNMPVGTGWIFRRGQQPLNMSLFDIESFLKEKKITYGKPVGKTAKVEKEPAKPVEVKEQVSKTYKGGRMAWRYL